MTPTSASAAPVSLRVVTALVAIVGVGAVLRFVALGTGIPFALGSDEHVLVERAVGMMRSGDYHPHFFDYPTFYIYVQVAVAAVRFLAGAIDGRWGSLAEAPMSAFYVWGRAMTAIIGTATIPLTWVILRRAGVTAGVLGALFVAVLPMHVRESRYALTDVPQTFLVLLALLLSVRAAERPTRGRFVWAGVAAGLAAATKYTGIVACVIPLVAVVLTPGRMSERTTRALLAGAGAAVAFLLAAPYTVLDLPGFLDGFAFLTQSYQGDTWNGITYLKHLRLNFGWPLVLTAAAGLAGAVVAAAISTGGLRVLWAATVVFVPLYFLFISNQSLAYGRYLLPIVPPLAMVGAAAAAWTLSRPIVRGQSPRTRRLLAGVLVAVLAFSPAVTAVRFVQGVARSSTAEATYEWLLANAPMGSRLAIENAALIPAGDLYRVNYERRLIDRSPDDYRAAGVDYLIASSTMFGGPLSGDATTADAQAYRELFRALVLVGAFRPSDDRVGPEIRIYRLP